RAVLREVPVEYAVAQGHSLIVPIGAERRPEARADSKSERARVLFGRAVDGLAGLIGDDRHELAALVVGQEGPLVERARPARDVLHRRYDAAGALHPGYAVALDVLPEQRRERLVAGIVVKEVAGDHAIDDRRRIQVLLVVGVLQPDLVEQPVQD